MSTDKSSMNPMVVMPQIYRFHFPNFPKQSKWGWHRATELMAAINNTQLLQGEKPMSPVQVAKEYPLVNPATTDDCVEPVFFHMIEQNRELSLISVREHNQNTWLDNLVAQDCYLPAKIGTQIIQAIEHPTYVQIRTKEVQKIAVV